MKIRILKKINKRIRIVETDDGMFEVQRRFSFKSKKLREKEWHTFGVFSTHKDAVKRKINHINTIIIKDLGLKNEFIRRRTKRMKRK